MQGEQEQLIKKIMKGQYAGKSLTCILVVVFKSKISV